MHADCLQRKDFSDTPQYQGWRWNTSDTQAYERVPVAELVEAFGLQPVLGCNSLKVLIFDFTARDPYVSFTKAAVDALINLVLFFRKEFKKAGRTVDVRIKNMNSGMMGMIGLDPSYPSLNLLNFSIPNVVTLGAPVPLVHKALPASNNAPTGGNTAPMGGKSHNNNAAATPDEENE